MDSSGANSLELAESSIIQHHNSERKDNINKQANMMSLFDKLIKLNLSDKDNMNSTDSSGLCRNESTQKCDLVKSGGQCCSIVADKRYQPTCQDSLTYGTREISLLDRITSKCKEKYNSVNKISEHPENSIFDHEQYITNKPHESNSWEKLLSGTCMKENIIQMIDLITSTNGSVDVNTKLNILTSLSINCAKHDQFCELLGSSRLVYYTGELLLLYSDTITKHNSGHTPLVPVPSVEELQLLTPIIKLLIPVANMNIQMVRSVFLFRSDVLSQLMRASSVCAYNIVHTLKKLEKLSQGKNVVCASLKMACLETNNIFEKCFGINIGSICINLVGYNMILFDTTDDTFDLNINEEIIKAQPLRGIVHAPSVDIDNDCTNVDNVEWSDIVVIRTFPPKYVLVYLKLEWQVYLLNMSAELYKIKDTYIKQIETLQQEDIVGFPMNVASFEGNALLTVPYLRGQVIAITGDRVMLWAMDVGLLCYAFTENLFSLADTTVITEAPLVSIGVLRGPICVVDEQFLSQSFHLLRVILESNTQSGKYMLLCDSGDDTLIFFEYPNYHIRIPLLDVLLTLTNNCKEVQTFMEKNKFDLILTGKLERYAHSYRSALYTNEAAFKAETLVISKILCTLLENKLNIKDWPGNKQASEVFKILREDHLPKWRKLFDRCLYLLRTKYIPRNHDISRRSHNNRRQNYARTGAYCSRLPKNNILVQPKPTDENNQTSCYYQYCDLQTTSSDTKVEAVKDVEVKIINIQTDYLLRGSKVDAKSCQTHHLMKERTLYQLKEIELAQILCGLLNNNVESSMYFGISVDSIVEGMLLSREDKDVFRNGIDRIMSKCLLPEVRVNCYEITFTPVLKPKDKVIDIHKNSLYVIEICVRPLMHMAYVLYQGRKCYMRQDTVTVEWTAMQKKNYMMEMEEKELNEAIESFKQVYDNNLLQLAAFVKKYLPKET